jgi:hypothetical protein
MVVDEVEEALVLAAAWVVDGCENNHFYPYLKSDIS